MPWQAELADDKDVERRAQNSSDFEGDWHASARQRDNDDVGLATILLQLCGKRRACLSSIGKRLIIRDSPHVNTADLR